MKLLRKILPAVLAIMISAALLTSIAAATGEGTDETVTSSIEQVSSVEETSSEEATSSEEETPSEESVSSEETTTSAPESVESEETTSSEEGDEVPEEDTESEIRIPSDDPYNGGTAGDWTDTEIDITVNSGEQANTASGSGSVKKDIFDLRSLAARLMVLTAIIGLLCLAALIYINVKNRREKQPEGEETKEKLKTKKKVSKKPRS